MRIQTVTSNPNKMRRMTMEEDG